MSAIVKGMDRGFVQSERGGLTVLNMFFLGTLAVTAGIAIDVSNLMKERTRLQSVADAAAHAALVAREYETPQEAMDTAVQLVSANMPPEKYGDVLRKQNVTFGYFDTETNVFTADPNSDSAVHVVTTLTEKNGNAVSSFLLQFAGIMKWDLRSEAIFETYYPTCLIEGFVSEGVIDIQSNNSYFNGFCIHSNSWVEINNNNFFEAGTVVSMPDKTQLVVSTTGNQEPKNEGIDEALREGRWFIKILGRLDEIRDGLQDRHSKYAREFVNNYNTIDYSVHGKLTLDDTMQKRRVHVADCGRITLKKGTYKNIVLIANCPITFESDVHLIESTILTTSTDAKALDSSHLVLGEADDCAAGGGTQLISYGGFEASSKLEMHGSQIIAAGDIEFSANADGIRGASLVAGGRIDGTSNMNFAFCGEGMEHTFMADYFRMAR